METKYILIKAEGTRTNLHVDPCGYLHFSPVLLSDMTPVILLTGEIIKSANDYKEGDLLYHNTKNPSLSLATKESNIKTLWDYKITKSYPKVPTHEFYTLSDLEIKDIINKVDKKCFTFVGL